MAVDPIGSSPWSEVLAAERAAIREPDGQNLGPDRPLTGLAFSGGGIRSATFNLGIIQALCELRLLRHFDYLSCVSGGGYIGGWLSAFIHRCCNGRVEDAEPQLVTGSRENPAIGFLRGYSNYLTPKASLLSADTLTAIATFVRNLYLNISLLVLALAAVLLVPRLLVWGIRWLADWQDSVADLGPLFTGGMVFLAIALLFIGLNLGRTTHQTKPFHMRQRGVLTLIVAPLVLSAWFLAYGLYAGSEKFARLSLAHWIAWGTAIYLLPYILGGALGFVLDRRDGHRRLWSIKKTAAMLTYAAIAGALGGVLLAGVAELTRLFRESGLGYMGSWAVSTFGTAVLLNAYSLAVVAHIGLMGRHFSHDAREWWSRLGGWVLLAACVWAAVFGVVFIAPAFFAWAHDALVAAGGVAWLGATLYGLLLGRSENTAGITDAGWRDRVAGAMPYVFIIGLLGLLSLGLHHLLNLPVLCERCVGSADGAQASLLATLDHGASGFKRVPAMSLLGLSILCGGGAVIIAWRLDVNLFALYYFYRQRLVRCYLGASRCESRDAHPFTGFDQDDDLALADLSTAEGTAQRCQRPCPIHNTALNLVAGGQLAWQERRAAAFAFTPLASGYGLTLPDARGARVEHFRPTAQYMGGVWIGTAMAISGAAASPNMGYHSSPALAFLMTVFNLRLGHWSPNPADDRAWTLHDPPFGGTYLIRELLGQTNLESPFAYLSDGGHFENLGVYELVRRRCACIVAIDAGQDAGSTFEDLGNAIRKCYADFGVTIAIGTQSLNSGYHAIGRIDYPDAPAGTLVYIKPRLLGDEPADLVNYAGVHAQFPHESTADQWFDESQFESYRKLGHHIGRAVFTAASNEVMQGREGADKALDLFLPSICELLRKGQSRST